MHKQEFNGKSTVTEFKGIGEQAVLPFLETPGTKVQIMITMRVGVGRCKQILEFTSPEFIQILIATNTINRVWGSLFPTTVTSHFLPKVPRLAMTERISQLSMPQLILISHNPSHSILIPSFGMFSQLEQHTCLRTSTLIP